MFINSWDTEQAGVNDEAFDFYWEVPSSNFAQDTDYPYWSLYYSIYGQIVRGDPGMTHLIRSLWPPFQSMLLMSAMLKATVNKQQLNIFLKRNAYKFNGNLEMTSKLNTPLNYFFQLLHKILSLLQEALVRGRISK
jgi:hypothetical protein